MRERQAVQRDDGGLPIAKRALACALAAALACACDGDVEVVARSTAAIVGGDADAADVAVVAVVRCDGECARDAAPAVSLACTGALVAPTLVLTARHCVAPVVDDATGVACSRTRFGAPFAASALAITASSAIAGARWIAAAKVHVPSADAFCGGDVALVELEAPVVAAPLAPRVGAAPRAGEPYAAIGFGATAPGGAGGARVRRDGLAVGCLDPACAPRGPDGAPAIAAGELIGAAGGCAGDSGGPALDVAGAIVGVLSRGDAACGTPVYERIDAQASWLKAVTARAAADGGYPVPTWATDPAVDASTRSDDASHTSASNLSPRGGCGVAPPALRTRGSLAACFLFLAARVRARRREQKC